MADNEATVERSSPEDLRTLVDERQWYHTLELAPGVVTKGLFDHVTHVTRYGIPADMSGLRALDVGSFDGFWAFEMERRGARVTALDVDGPEELDWPPRLRALGAEAPNAKISQRTNFALARGALNSAVERASLSVYEATPERLGTFDVVFCGSLLIHLRDPLLALERMAALCSGRLVLAEAYSRRLDWIPRVKVAEFRGETPWMTWWLPTSRTLAAMTRCAGFEEVRLHDRFLLPFREGRGGVRHAIVHARGPGGAPEPT